MDDEYWIEYMADDKMGGQDFILCNERGGVTLYIRRGVRDLPDAENAAVWLDAWRAFRDMADVDEIPAQRTHANSRARCREVERFSK